MPQFDIEHVELPEPMSYDFTGFGQAGVKGEIPEPSDKQIRQFLRDMASLYNIGGKAEDPEAETRSRLAEFGQPLAWLEVVTEKSEEDFAAAKKQVLTALQRLCSNKPTMSQLDKLDQFVLDRFVAFVMKGFLDPESRTAATKPSPEGSSGGESTTSSEPSSATA